MAPRNRNVPKASASSGSNYTRADMEREFPDDATCLDYLWRQNCSWDGSHALCPKCDQARKFHRVVSRPSYSCDVCGHHLHPTAGTIFHKSSTGLDIWFRAIFLMSSTRCGTSAKQLERELGVTYKTAWRMANLIRNQLMEQDPDLVLGDRVEMDETYWGGKARASDRRKWNDPRRTTVAQAQSWAAEKKTPVFGMVERNRRLFEDGRTRPVILEHGQVAAWVVPKEILHTTITDKVADHLKSGASIYTDDSRLYDRASLGGDHLRYKIAHSRGSYVNDHIHTQQIEGFWSLLKRGLHGAHHSVSEKWMQGYVNEYVYRYNHRADLEPMFKSLLASSARRRGLAAS
ncbi:MAG: IS1595 family transposase [Acidimicrobiales bacterium]